MHIYIYINTYSFIHTKKREIDTQVTSILKYCNFIKNYKKEP